MRLASFRHGARRGFGVVKDEHVEGGSIWATFDPDAPSFAEYCGPEILGYVRRLFGGRALRLLGYNRQLIPSNWKMYVENLKDPYHATLLHSFLITFGLWRADTQSESIPTEGGKHGIMELALVDGEVDVLRDDEAAERLVQRLEAKQAHERVPIHRSRTQPQMPCGRNITHRMKMTPTHSSQYSVCELTTYFSSRNTAAPIAGPTIVPVPPRITMDLVTFDSTVTAGEATLIDRGFLVALRDDSVIELAARYGDPLELLEAPV